ncbi:hypothetical protein Peur_041741 [Populus x canadensis]
MWTWDFEHQISINNINVCKAYLATPLSVENGASCYLVLVSPYLSFPLDGNSQIHHSSEQVKLELREKKKKKKKKKKHDETR